LEPANGHGKEMAMRVHERGQAGGPVVVLIHGYGTSWQSWRTYVETWESRYRLVLPVLGGMDPDGQSEFAGVEAEADAIADYLVSKHRGKAFAVVGVSLGATIAMELLSRDDLVFDHAVLDAGPGAPASKAFVNLAVAVRRWQNRSLRNEGLAHRSVRRSYMASIADDIIETCSRMSDRSCEAVQRAAFGYCVRPSIGRSPCNISYWYGSKEQSMLRKTVRLLRHYRPKLEVRRFAGLNHGQLWAERPTDFMREAEGVWGKTV
jgi:pimeloyl-ACP methyl ester carboxylesterase